MSSTMTNRTEIKAANALAKIIYLAEVKGKTVPNLAEIKAQYVEAMKKLG